MSLRFFTAGESHGPQLTAILDGMPAGLAISQQHIDGELARRQTGVGSGGRMKIEKDQVEITSGVMEGLTTGAPITLIVKNLDHVKWQDKAIPKLHSPRPGHADLTGVLKYTYNDIRPTLERSSARETTMRVAVGALIKQLLAEFDIKIGGYIHSIGDVVNTQGPIDHWERFIASELTETRCPDAVADKAVRELIDQVMRSKNTLGGVVEVFALGVPVGLGSYAQWDRRLEAKICAALMSVQAMKGVEIGDAWENSKKIGTDVHDAIVVDGDELTRTTNRAGGIEGGISNGQPIVARAAMKPIASTLTPQRTVDLKTWKEVNTTYERSDFCPVPRAVPILEAMLAFVIADALIEKIGGDSIAEMKPRFSKLAKAERSAFNFGDEDHVFWGSRE